MTSWISVLLKPEIAVRQIQAERHGPPAAESRYPTTGSSVDHQPVVSEHDRPGGSVLPPLPRRGWRASMALSRWTRLVAARFLLFGSLAK